MMRKEILNAASMTAVPAGFDLETKARVRLTSEDPHHPIEHALRQDSEDGWRAAAPGPQTITFEFDAPATLQEIWLRFESAEARTQEFQLAVACDPERSLREIVRQQFNFSPDGAKFEEERYRVNLTGVTGLTLSIVPDVSGGDAIATLRLLRLR